MLAQLCVEPSVAMSQLCQYFLCGTWAQVTNNICISSIIFAAQCITLYSCFLPTVPSGYPQNFSVSSESSHSALFIWTPPHESDRNGIITEYTINISAVETGEELQLQLNSSTTSVTVTTLTPYTTHFCIIAASTSVGIGPFSTIISFLTPEDGIFS